METLETEIKKFSEELPYWKKYLVEKVMSGSTISDIDIDASYSYLLEQLKLIKETSKPTINVSYNAGNTGHYKSNLLLSKLENVEGVNALTENQTTEFSQNLTIIYGVNGSGKSGYVRLLKQAFYSKVPEEILPNIHIENGHKPINAKFIFSSNGSEIPLEYSDKDSAVFQQFAVFDGKSVLSQLEQRNEFEFRPAGLGFFANFIKAINRVEQKVNLEIQNRQSENEFSLWFDGYSEIKTLVENLSAITKLEDLNKHTPFSEADKAEKSKVQKQYDELLLASTN